jgi:hypothetical protein
MLAKAAMTANSFLLAISTNALPLARRTTVPVVMMKVATEENWN